MRGIHITIIFGIQWNYIKQDSRFELGSSIETLYDPAKELLNLKNKCVKDYGGYTITECSGGWLNKETKQIHEKSIKLEIDIQIKNMELSKCEKKNISELSEWIKSHFRQEKIIVRMQELIYL